MFRRGIFCLIFAAKNSPKPKARMNFKICTNFALNFLFVRRDTLAVVSSLLVYFIWKTKSQVLVSTITKLSLRTTKTQSVQNVFLQVETRGLYF